ncbi:MAG: zinc-ribbon domain-containing protein [Anaerolineae bacterium]
MIIFFGSKVRKKKLGSGQFYCPRCKAMRPYTHQQGTRYFTVYFIPIIPMGDVGEFIECDVCHSMFQLDALKAKPAQKPLDLAGMLNTLKPRLEHGVPVEYAVRDLTSAGLDLDMARKAIDNAIGLERNGCKTCGLTYSPAVITCTECNGALETYRK